VDWSSRKQRTVSTSPQHAEYYAACEGGKDSLHIKHMLEEILPHKSKRSFQLPVTLRTDSTGAEVMIKNTVNNRRNRHYEIWMHAIRDWCKKGWIMPKRVSTECNIADGLTKPHGPTALAKLREQYGLR
jgi:hypothetical protein